MVVAVQKGLMGIKNSLIELGYDVVTYGEFNGIIDALVYSGSMYNDNLKMGSVQMMNFSENQRILMINATNKSINEIDLILKKKVYSPLF